MTKGAKTGENRFKKAKDKDVAKRIDAIRKILKAFAASSVSFSTITALARSISTLVNEQIEASSIVITKKGSGKISHSTLLRTGSKYRHILESYFIAQKGNKETISSKYNNVSLELEIVQLKVELKATKSLIDSRALVNCESEGIDSTKITKRSTEDMIALDACYKTIFSLLEASDGVFIFSNDEILHTAKIVDNVIVDEKMLNSTGIKDCDLFLMEQGDPDE
jgi:hypothetical protein